MQQMELMQTDVLRCCGRLALESGLYPHAFEMLTRALDREPTDPNTLLLLSKAYLQSSDAASVIRMLVNAINAGVSTIASDSRVWTVLALCYDQLDGFADSLHAVTQALLLESYYSVDPDLHVMQCRFFLRQGVHQYPLEALLPYFDKMLESVKVSAAPAAVHVEALVTRAQLLYKYSEFERALVDLELAIGLLNGKKESFKTGERLAKISYTYLLASVLQFLSNRASESLKLVEDAIVYFPHTAKSVQPLLLASGMMNSLMERDLYATLDRMVLEEPHSAPGSAFQMNYVIARLLLQLDPVRNVYEAYGYYRRALNLDITRPYTWISIGSLYLRLGQINDALSAYTQGSVLALESVSAPANAGAASTSNGAATAGGSSTAAQSSFMANFNYLFAALAWFGIAQTYIFGRDLSSAVDALSRSGQFFVKANNPHQADELQRQADSLSAHLANPGSSINIEYTIPDVPFQLLLDLLLYEDHDAFTVKDRIERNQEDSITRATAVTFSRSPSTTFVKLENYDAKKMSTSPSATSSGSSNKVEKKKSNDRSRKNSTSYFRRTSFPASKSPPLVNTGGSFSNGNPPTSAPLPITALAPAAGTQGSTLAPAPGSAQAAAPGATPTTAANQLAASVPTAPANHTSHDANKSSTNSPILVHSQQRLTPLLPNNNFAHQYSQCARQETIPQMANPINAYYHPQMIPNVGSGHTVLQRSQGTAPPVYQNYHGFAAHPRQMSTYVYYP